MDTLLEYPMYYPTAFSVEEINLMCVYDTSDRYILIEEMEAAQPYITEPEMLALMQLTLDKLYVTSDRHFAELPLYPADDMEVEADMEVDNDPDCI